MQHTCYSTQEMEPVTDESDDYMKAQLGEPMHFYRDYKQECVGGVTYRNRNDSKASASPRSPLPNDDRSLHPESSLNPFQAAPHI